MLAPIFCILAVALLTCVKSTDLEEFDYLPGYASLTGPFMRQDEARPLYPPNYTNVLPSIHTLFPEQIKSAEAASALLDLQHSSNFYIQVTKWKLAEYFPKTDPSSASMLASLTLTHDDQHPDNYWTLHLDQAPFSKLIADPNIRTPNEAFFNTPRLVGWMERLNQRLLENKIPVSGLLHANIYNAALYYRFRECKGTSIPWYRPYPNSAELARPMAARSHPHHILFALRLAALLINYNQGGRVDMPVSFYDYFLDRLGPLLKN